MFCSKARWIEQGEKPTKYFFNLEKKKYEKKVIKELKTENPAELLTNFKDIGNKIEEHFTQLLSRQIVEDETMNKVNFDSFVKELEIPKLAKEEQDLMEHDLSIEEIKNAIKHFQKRKTPGVDGFPVEFYETFIEQIGPNLLDSYNEAFQENKLSGFTEKGNHHSNSQGL